MGRKYTIEEVREIVGERKYTLFDEGYRGLKYLIILLDEDGYRVSTCLKTFINGATPRKFDTHNKHTIYNIKRWLVLNNKQIEYVEGEYKKIKSNMIWKCLKCNDLFETQFYYMYYSNSGCPICAGQKLGISNSLSEVYPSLAQEIHPVKNGNLNGYMLYHRAKDYIWWQCSKNKSHEWQSMVLSRAKGGKCPYCIKRRASAEYNLFTHNPKICEEWDYDKNKHAPDKYLPNSGKKVWWKCKKCDRERYLSIGTMNIYNETCSCKDNRSKGERAICSILESYKIEFISEYIFKDCKDVLPLPFDFYLPTYHKIVEFHGRQHYEPVKHFGGEERFVIQQEHDDIKRNYCKNNNIDLLEISYLDFNNIEEILKKELKL